MPEGVSYTDNGDGTATLAGTPAAGTGGVYRLTITAANGVSPDATQEFVLTVGQPPAISPSGALFTIGRAESFTVTTSGFPAPALSVQGTLPAGVTFTDNGDGTATLAGTPAAGTAGSYPLTITAANGVSPDATRVITLTIGQAPAITSAAAATFTTGQAGELHDHDQRLPGSAAVSTGGVAGRRDLHEQRRRHRHARGYARRRRRRRLPR